MKSGFLKTTDEFLASNVLEIWWDKDVNVARDLTLVSGPDVPDDKYLIEPQVIIPGNSLEDLK